MNKRVFLLSAGFGIAGCAFRSLAPVEAQKMTTTVDLLQIRPYEVGQSWRYKKLNFFNSQQVDEILEAVEDIGLAITIRRKGKKGSLSSALESKQGHVIQDPYWDQEPRYLTPVPLWPQDLALNSVMEVTTNYKVAGDSSIYWTSTQRRVTGFEKLNLQSGVFETVRIESLIRLSHPDFNRQSYMRRDTLWIAPQLGRWVVRETQGDYLISTKKSYAGRDDIFRYELIDWS